jgi:hypothetical protein
MRFRALLGFVLGALACVYGAARLTADDAPAPAPAPAKPTAAERAEKVLAALPLPSVSDPWAFEADVFINGAVQGSARFTLTPVKEAGADLWKSSDGVRFGPVEAPAATIAMEALFDPQLTTLSGTTVSASPGQPPVTFSWRRTPLGYGLERQEGEKEVERLMLRDVPYLKTSVSGLVRFLRAVPAEPATYAVQVLNQEANVGMTAETRVRAATIEVLGVKPFAIGGGEREVWLARVTQGTDDERFFAFDPKDRWLLTVTKPSSKLEIRRKGLEVAAKTPEPPIDWKAPARTAEMAAMQVGRAFATCDLEALDKITWWPTAHEGLKKDPTLAALEEGPRKEALFASLKEKLPKFPPTMIEAGLVGARKELVVAAAGKGRKRVTFPPMFRSMVVDVIEVEGTWYLAEYPMSAPKETPPEAPPAPPPPPPPGAPK